MPPEPDPDPLDYIRSPLNYLRKLGIEYSPFDVVLCIIVPVGFYVASLTSY